MLHQQEGQLVQKPGGFPLVRFQGIPGLEGAGGGCSILFPWLPWFIVQTVGGRPAFALTGAQEIPNVTPPGAAGLRGDTRQELPFVLIKAQDSPGQRNTRGHLGSLWGLQHSSWGTRVSVTSSGLTLLEIYTLKNKYKII